LSYLWSFAKGDDCVEEYKQVIPKIIFAELGKEGGANLLKRKVEYHRKQTTADPLEQIDLAKVLVEYAQALLKDEKSSAARKHVEEAINIYENQLEKWDDDMRGDLETANKLLKQVENGE
jgi:hypothetical protein